MVSKVSVPTQQSRSDREKGFLFRVHSEQWTSTRIAINMDEVAKRIEDDKKWTGGIRSPQAWAHYLNKSIRDGINQEGLSHLVLQLDGNNKFWAGAVVVATLLTAANIDPLSIIEDIGSPRVPDIHTFIRDYFGMSLVMNFMHRITARSPRLHDISQRYSLFYGPEIDRAIALNLLAPKKQLIKAF